MCKLSFSFKAQKIHNQGFHNTRIFPGRRQNCVGEGSVLMAYIMQSFHKFIVSLFCPISLPIRAALCKLLVGAMDTIPTSSNTPLKCLRHASVGQWIGMQSGTCWTKLISICIKRKLRDVSTSEVHLMLLTGKNKRKERSIWGGAYSYIHVFC